TIGADHPRPGIVATHSTFSVFDQRSGSALLSPIGFRSGPRNCGQSGSAARTTMLNQSNATNHFIPSIIGASPRHTRSCPLISLDASADNWLTLLHAAPMSRARQRCGGSQDPGRPQGSLKQVTHSRGPPEITAHDHFSTNS